jgi:hypothetical protein
VTGDGPEPGEGGGSNPFGAAPGTAGALGELAPPEVGAGGTNVSLRSFGSNDSGSPLAEQALAKARQERDGRRANMK